MSIVSIDIDLKSNSIDVTEIIKTPLARTLLTKINKANRHGLNKSCANNECELKVLIISAQIIHRQKYRNKKQNHEIDYWNY